jgi:hypothetical protein
MLVRPALIAAAVAAFGATPAVAAGTLQGTLAVQAIAPPTADLQPVTATAQATISNACDAATFCGYAPKVTTIAASAQCSPQVTSSSWAGDALSDAQGRRPQAFTATWQERPWVYAGPKRACLYVFDGTSDILVAEATYTVPGVPAPTPQRPDPTGADLIRSSIPRAVGVRRSFAYQLSSANVPRAVGAKRFAVIARTAAKRWGLRDVGTTRGAPRSGDGRDTVGFARDVPRVALGVTRIRSVRYYRRVGGVTRVVRERVVERDLSLAVGVPWHVGPGTPPSDEVDLQTVVVHELGHYAGNGHVRDCANSPMWTGLRPGEWWYSRADWFQFGCSNAPGATATAAAARASRSPAPGAGDARPLLVQRTVRKVFLG